MITKAFVPCPPTVARRDFVTFVRFLALLFGSFYFWFPAQTEAQQFLQNILDQEEDIELDEWPYSIIYIERIDVMGNEKTAREEILRISQLREGQELGRDRSFEAKRRLLSAGNFEDVYLRVRPSKQGKAIVEIEVKEKTTWFIIPYFEYSEGTFGGGVAFAESNLFGESKQVLFGGAITNRRKAAVAGYRDPAVLRSMATLEIDGVVRFEKLPVYDDSKLVREIDLREMGTTILPGVQWTGNFSSSVGVFFRSIRQRVAFQEEGVEDLSEDVLKDGIDVAGKVRFRFDNTNYVDGLMSGFFTQVEVYLSDKRFWSDFEYTRQTFRLNWGARFGEDSQFGFLSNFTAQFGQRLPFYRQLSVGGTVLRGYRADAFRGDTRYSFTQELQAPLFRFNRAILRAIGFWDLGILYFQADQFSTDAIRNGVGAGLRLYMRGVDIPAIGYDLAWGVESQSFQHYLNVGASF